MGTSAKDGDEIFCKQIASKYKPKIYDAGKIERLCSCLPELCDARVCSEGCHCHGEHECGDYFNGFECGGKPCLILAICVEETVESNHKEEDKGKPWHADFFLVTLSVTTA